MIDPADEGQFELDVGRRLRRTREAIWLNQQQFGTRAGMSQPQYNQFENGGRLITLRCAMKLCDEYLLTLDWIYRGDPSGLPYRLAEAIRTTP